MQDHSLLKMIGTKHDHWLGYTNALKGCFVVLSSILMNNQVFFTLAGQIELPVLLHFFSFFFFFATLRGLWDLSSPTRD